MGLEAATLAYIAVGASAVSMYGQYESGKKASAAAERQAAAQRESQAAQAKMAEAEAHRSRIAQVREARIRRSRVESAQGLSFGSSSGIGAISSIQSQMGANIGTINQTQTFAQEATAANQRAATESANIFTAQQEGQFWGQFGQTFGADKQDFKTIFAKK